MPSLAHPLLIPGALVTVALASALFLAASRNATMKRRLAPLLVVANAGAMLALVFALGPARVTPLLVVLGAAAAALVILALSAARYCDACGHTVVPRGLQHARECPRCGDDLRAQRGARAAGIAREPLRRASRA